MKHTHRMIKSIVLYFLDLIVMVIAYSLASGLRFNFEWQAMLAGGYRLNVAQIIIMMTICHLIFDWDRNYMQRRWWTELKVVIFYNIAVLIGIILLAFVMGTVPLLSRLVSGYFLLINVFFMFVARTLMRRMVNAYYHRSSSLTNILVITDQENYDNVKKNFYPGTTYHVIGRVIVNDGQVKGSVEKEEIACSLDEFLNKVVAYPIDDVFIKEDHFSTTQLDTILDNFESMGAVCNLAISVPKLNGYSSIGKFGEFPAVTYSLNNPNQVELIIKRIVDIIGAIVGLILCGIIFLFVAPAIKLDSPGPVIFSQIRIGKNGKRFKFYKFRSMYIDAEERKKELMKNNQMNGLMFKMDDDPRITKVGKFIRKTSLDEFPQFFNVLKGDMSLVGTRPPTEEEFLHYDAHYKRRLSMDPGITGLWQVSGRSKITDFDEVVKLDLEYIDNWSLGLDAKILFKTIAVVFQRKGAE